MVRVNIRVSDEIKKYFDDESKSSGVPVSTLMYMALKNYVEMYKTIDVLPGFLKQVEAYTSKLENFKTNMKGGEVIGKKDE